MAKRQQRSSDTYEYIDEEERVLENSLNRLTTIRGFKTVAVMTHTGEILASDTVDTNINLHNVGSVFNDIFSEAHDAAEKIGLGVCQEATINTPKGLVIMRCSGVKSPIHFHLIAILSSDGNQALAKMELEKLVPQVSDALT